MKRLPTNFTWISVSLLMTGLLVALCYVPPSSASHPALAVNNTQKQPTKSKPTSSSTESRFGDFGGAPPNKTGNVTNLKQTSGHGKAPTTQSEKVNKKTPKASKTPSKKSNTEPQQHYGDFGGG
jgi:hypothetical protein